MFARRTLPLALVLLVFWTAKTAAQPLAPEDVPSVLKPWIGWALAGSEDAQCPQVGEIRTCIWPSTLTIDARDTGATFTFNVTTFRRALITLPGSANLWPLDVRVDNGNAIVIEPSGSPQIEVGPGGHIIQGRFAFRAMPDSMSIPAQVAHVILSIDQKRIATPRREESGVLWLRQAAAGGDETESIQLQVHRRIEDGIPLRIITRIQMAVSGKAREIVLPNVLLGNARPIELSSQLPARLTPDGTLRIQAEAGTFTFEIVAVRETDASELKAPQGKEPWPDSETWVFVADDALRHVEVSGPPSIDPARTDLPTEWHGFPTYVVNAQTPLKLEEKRRGQPDPAPNALTINRSLWLDINGDEYTVRDEVRGTMNRDFRLDLLEGELGRATVNGRDEMVTRLGEHAGIELRRSGVQLDAEWRFRSKKSLPAVGWSEDVRELRTTLHLPPDYTLLGAEGVDQLPGTWLDSWDLWDFFFVLLIAIAVGKLSSPLWGALSLCTLVLCHHEPGAPEFVWLWLLSATALIRVFKEAKLLWVATALWFFGLFALLIVAVPFSVTQLRKALYPHLEQEQGLVTMATGMLAAPKARETENLSPEGMPAAPAPEAPAADESSAGAAPEEAAAERSSKSADSALGDLLGRGYESAADVRATPQKKGAMFSAGEEVDPNAVVQTGPGLPSWSFQEFSLSWSGPVQRDQRIKLWLVPPIATRIWSLLTVLLTFGLLFALARARTTNAPTQPPGKMGVTATLTLLACLVFTTHAVAQTVPQASVIPPSEVLTELRNRLLEPAACEPNCASVSELSVSVLNDRLILRAKVHAASSTAYRTPGPLASFSPDDVKVDARPVSAALRADDDFLLVRLDKGIHTVELSGPISRAQALTLSLGTPPHRVTVDARGFDVDGLHDDATAEGSLRLRPQITETEADTATAHEALQPWLVVERRLDLGVRFRVKTTVRRIGPASESVLVRIPLLASESVTEASLTVIDRQVVVELPRGGQEMSFTSTLTPAQEVTLEAALPADTPEGPATRPWTEVWQVACTSLLHCTFEGIAPISRIDALTNFVPTYKPWPGESLKIRTARLPPEKGASLTVDKATLELTPGSRLEQSVLRATVRTSRGTTERFIVPKNERLTRVTVDGTERPMRLKDGALELALSPGSHEITVEMQRPSGIGTSYHGPEVRIGRPLTNATTTVTVPSDRWLLWAGGPPLGPAILFWGYLLLVILCAVGLGRVPYSPLKSYQWILLGLGLTQVPVFIMLFIIGWFFALSYREREPLIERWAFNLMQIGLVIATVIALLCLGGAIHTGLVVQPDMQVQGMGSTNQVLRWYEDRTSGVLPEVTVISAPLWIYKALMLAWALWLASSLLAWLRWGFAAWRSGETWRQGMPEAEAAQNPRVALEDIEAAQAALAAKTNKAKTDAGDP